MEQDKLKILKIINELSVHCMNLGAIDLHVTIPNVKKKDEIHLQCTIHQLDSEEIEKLNERLGVPRQEEFEDYLWELAGGSVDYRELTLVGMMIDKAVISYKDTILKISIYR